MSDTPIVWGLLDDRPGNNAQVRGVVERFGWLHEYKTFYYNGVARVPNLLRGASLVGVAREASSPLAPPWPEVVVSAGRRLSPVALYIKKQSPETFLVHLMKPGITPARFDLLAIPEHDGAVTSGNVIATLGAPNRIMENTLATHRAPWVMHLSSPRIGVLIGGDTSYGKYEEGEFFDFVHLIEKLIPGGSWLATTSRRTPLWAAETLSKVMERHAHLLYRADRPEGDNPYMQILGCADVLFVTGDSVSMCSEACATGKPVYIHTPRCAASPKHRRFIASLFERGYARPVEQYDPAWKPDSTLDEAEKLAKTIKQKIRDRHRLLKQ